MIEAMTSRSLLLIIAAELCLFKAGDAGRNDPQSCDPRSLIVNDE